MVEIENKILHYETYKDSGVEWLGEIPEHWKIERGKWLFIKNERTIHENDQIITCFRDGEVTLRSNRKKSGFTVALKEHGYQGIRKGDLVIHAMDAFAGAIGVSDSDGKSTPVYSVCTERVSGTVNQYYYSYFLRSLALNGIILALAKGIRERSTDFRFSDFGELLLSYPPLKEQTAIAQFLDYKTVKIDEAIAIKEQQISLLKERKQILIYKAVTQGLNPNVTLKNSGVDWIGEIPEHWEIVKNKSLFSESNNEGEENLPLLSVSIHTGVSSEELNDEENVRGRVKIEDKKKYKLVLKNDIVFNMMRAWQGAIGAVSVKGMVSPAYVVATPNNKVNSLFFENQYRTPSFIEQINQNSKGITDFRKRLYWNEFKQLKTILPPLSEQIEISDYIQSASKKTETAIGLKQQEISKLKEYKSSLINSVVTGKVKVC